MIDTIMEMPYNCGEKDCPVGWHKTSYHIRMDGAGYTVCDEDGDHEDIDEEELPSWDEYDQGMESVLQGRCMVGNRSVGPVLGIAMASICLPPTYKAKRRYKVEIRNSIGGVMVCRWKPGRKQWESGHLPRSVAEYLGCYKYDEKFNMIYGRRPLKDPGHDVAAVDAGYRWDEFMEVIRSEITIDKVTRSSRVTVLHLLLEEKIERKKSAVERELKARARKAIKEK